jgi:hypothetical protein
MCKPRVAASSAATASKPVSGLPEPNASPLAQVTAAASAPSAAPTIGSAVIAPPPSGRSDAPGSGTTVSNAKAVASERITV